MSTKIEDDLRWILLNILWHSLPAGAVVGWQIRQMEKAGASPDEIKRLTGEQ